MQLTPAHMASRQPSPLQAYRSWPMPDACRDSRVAGPLPEFELLAARLPVLAPVRLAPKPGLVVHAISLQLLFLPPIPEMLHRSGRWQFAPIPCRRRQARAPARGGYQSTIPPDERRTAPSRISEPGLSNRPSGGDAPARAARSLLILGRRARAT